MAEEQTFWQHLDVLRTTLIHCIIAVMGCGVVAFCLKDQLFQLILWPQKADFPTYRLLLSFGPLSSSDMPAIELINTGLAQQFIIHMQTALALGAMAASPYILYELMRFISPALYPHERKASFPAVIAGYVMFLLGVALSYLLIFPFTFRFLGTYQVQESVANLITLDSYISTLLVMSILMGVLFELPILSWVMAKLGMLKADFMSRYRRHAIVIILIIAAVITPTGDAFTLSLVALPVYLLYELSIWVVKAVEKNKKSA